MGSTFPARGTVATRSPQTREQFHLRGWLLIGSWRGQDVWQYPNPPMKWWERILGFWA